MEAPPCEEMRGRGEGLGQASGVVPQGQLAELGLDRKKKSAMILPVKGVPEQIQVKGK